MTDYFVYAVKLGVFVVVTAVWAVVGLILWLPFLVRVIAMYTVAVITSMLTGVEPGNVEQAIHTAIEFYPSGFRRVFRVLRTDEPPAAFDPGSLHLYHFALAMAHLAYSVSFWIGLLWLLGVRDVRGILSSGATGPARPSLVGSWVSQATDVAFEFVEPDRVRIASSRSTGKPPAFFRLAAQGKYRVVADTLLMVLEPVGQEKPRRFVVEYRGDTLMLQGNSGTWRLTRSLVQFDQLLLKP